MSTTGQEQLQPTMVQHPAEAASDSLRRSAKDRRWTGAMIFRGEAMIVFAGLGVGLLLFTAIGIGSWQTLVSQKRAGELHRVEQFETVINLLALSVQSTLTHNIQLNERESLRRLLAGTSGVYGLEKCVLRFPSGAIVADGVKADSNSKADEPLPETWGDVAGAPLRIDRAMVEHDSHGGVSLKSQVWIPRRGPLTLEISDSDPPMAAGAEHWKKQAAVGMIGAAMMGVLLTVYCVIRSKLRALAAIDGALCAIREGEQDEDALRVRADLGSAADVWNRLMGERQRLRENATGCRIVDEIGARRGRDTEVASACDALWQGVLLVDELGKVKFANGAAGVFLQTKREELANKDLGLFLKDSRAISMIADVATGKIKQKSVVEIERTGDQGEGTLRCTVRPIRKEDHGRALVVIEDVTQQKIADDARNTFVAQATHELRTPLTNIRLYLDTLIEDGDEDPLKRATALNVISQEARRLERIVSDMLSVAQIEAGQLKIEDGDVRLNALFDELEADFREQARQKEIILRFDLAPKLPVLMGDRDKIALTIHNLVANAIKYTPAGGEVKVRVEQVGSELVVEVKDNGIGIRPEEQERVFEKFYRAKDKRIAGITGTGLGLALSREIARLHGGEIMLESQIDRGSTFTLRLPVRSPRESIAA